MAVSKMGPLLPSGSHLESTLSLLNVPGLSAVWTETLKITQPIVVVSYFGDIE